MSLDLTKLENVRERGACIRAACPACREVGADKKGEHLFICEDGKFGCVANQGEAGREHRRRIYALAGEKKSRLPFLTCYSVRPAGPPKSKPVAEPSPKREVKFPALRRPTAEELATIARVRGWPHADGLEVLAQREMLFTCSLWDDGREWPAWLVTDPTRRNAQARRMDGQVWRSIGSGNAKARSVTGTTAKRCIGASLIGEQTKEVWLMEGTPDLCAAPILAKGVGLDLNTLAFVCMTGAGNDLHAEDLPHFRGKPVVIAVHNDIPRGEGAKAAQRWAAQLRAAGAGPVTGFDFSAYACKDLSDYLALERRAKESAAQVKGRELADAAKEATATKTTVPETKKRDPAGGNAPAIARSPFPNVRNGSGVRANGTQQSLPVESINSPREMVEGLTSPSRSQETNKDARSRGPSREHLVQRWQLAKPQGEQDEAHSKCPRLLPTVDGSSGNRTRPPNVRNGEAQGGSGDSGTRQASPVKAGSVPAGSANGQVQGSPVGGEQGILTSLGATATSIFGYENSWPEFPLCKSA
ncbi:hypothetical protein AXK11_01510 [Cephaloticoccus primus]|uniref:Uncharacterized protein n=1 Tax=Cephaloticoccus primus TaxID=1548207 RepID=A0A139STC8_9BACT|nr:hypothetical protein [Cephaloticoccus primus]KXU37858.1 hypothetical protein AXK11_01510 [Cephaloticoccus primus]